MHHRRPTDRVAMTPMIDVVFLLVIFFLVSSHLSRRENRMPVSLAEAATGATDDVSIEATITLTIDVPSRLFLNGERLSMEDLAQQLPHDSSTAIRIRIDQEVVYEHLSRVLAILSGAGFPNVSIVTRPTVGSR